MAEKENRCKIARRCGGCKYQGVEYRKQLKRKQDYIDGLLGSFGKPEKIIGMENPFYYRNKVHHAFTKDRSGNIISGPYEAGSHWILQSDNCLIEDRESQEIMHGIRGLMKRLRVRPYNEDSGYGTLRHVLIRKGFQSGQIMVVLVIGSDRFPAEKAFVRELLKLSSKIKTVVLNYNGKKTSMILGEREKVLYGPGYIYDELCGKKFRISSKSFYQVNPVQTEILYKLAVQYAGLTGCERVFDAYCGVGTIGLVASEKAGEVIGVELNEDAVRDAKINARENKIETAKFYQGDAGAFMNKMASKKEKVDVVFMDPPRSGSSIKFMDAVVRLRSEKVVYISCGPESLARDLRYFRGNGYKIEKIQPVDMFPFTEHLETIVLLSKRKIDSKR